MRRKLCLMLTLLLTTCIFAEGKTYRQQQFEVKDSFGHIFALQEDLQKVTYAH